MEEAVESEPCELELVAQGGAIERHERDVAGAQGEAVTAGSPWSL
jgi:hypothetical protein